MSFSSLQLNEKILLAIQESGFTDATEIQTAAIPVVLQGSDIKASAQTGTGKTAAFVLPILHKLASSPGKPGRGPRALILVPTRELAVQVSNETSKFSKHLPRMKTVCVYGGVPYRVQNKDLSRPYEILVATPGRLLDYMGTGRIDLSRVEILVLDEADRMLDMGFIEPVEEIAAATPKQRQTLMFSATLRGAVVELGKRLLKDPVDIIVTPTSAAIDQIEQRLHYVDSLSHKHDLLEHLLTDPSLKQAIIFIATKQHADDLADKLREIGHSVASLHGDMNQRQRTRTMRQMRSGEIQILVATDIAARGLDVQSISHVINFDLPMSAEDYVHRIGRTGRAGAKGTALSFASQKDQRLVQQIERFTKQKLQAHIVPGMEPKRNFHDRESRPGRPNHQGSRFSRQRPQASSGNEPRRNFLDRDARPGRPYGQKRRPKQSQYPR